MEIIASTLFELPAALDEKDQPILCAAIKAKCDLLATGDRRHFAQLYDTTVEGVTIVSLLGLAKRLSNGKKRGHSTFKKVESAIPELA